MQSGYAVSTYFSWLNHDDLWYLCPCKKILVKYASTYMHLPAFRDLLVVCYYSSMHPTFNMLQLHFTHNVLNRNWNRYLDRLVEPWVCLSLSISAVPAPNPKHYCETGGVGFLSMELVVSLTVALQAWPCISLESSHTITLVMLQFGVWKADGPALRVTQIPITGTSTDPSQF